MKTEQTGFTLVEIAIVLVIIGLLLGGTLKGQELINNAKVKHMLADFRNIPVLVYGYQDKFRAIPGDDASARTHLGAAAIQITGVGAGGTAGNGRLDGTWDSMAAADETYVIWQHVRLAGLSSGSTRIDDPAYRPSNADGGAIGIESVAQGNGTPYLQDIGGTYLLCSTGILGKFARQIDTALDDGNGASGQVRIVAMSSHVRNGSGGIDNASNPAGIDDAARHTVCMAF